MENLSFFRRGFERLVFLFPLFLDFDFFARGIVTSLLPRSKTDLNPHYQPKKRGWQLNGDVLFSYGLGASPVCASSASNPASVLLRSTDPETHIAYGFPAEALLQFSQDFTLRDLFEFVVQCWLENADVENSVAQRHRCGVDGDESSCEVVKNS